MIVFIIKLYQVRFYMVQSRFLFLLLLTLLNFSSVTLFAQKKVLSIEKIKVLLNNAQIELESGKFEKSLLNSRIALEQSIELKNSDLIATAYLIIGGNFDDLIEPEKALYYYNLGLSHANKTYNSSLKNQFYNNLGNIYNFDKKQFDKGIYYYKKSLHFSSKVLDRKQIFVTKLNIAWAYFDIEKYEEGLPYLEYVNKYEIIDGDNSTIVAVNMLNGMYSSFKNDIEKTNYYFNKAIEQGSLGYQKSDLSYSYFYYSNFLYKIGDYKKAFVNLSLYKKISEEQNLADNLYKANAVGIDLEIDKYKRQIDKIESEFKLKQEHLLTEQSRTKKIVAFVILLLLSTVVFFYFIIQTIRLKEKNKRNAIQSYIHQNIINASIDGQELERKKIAAFLHDTISSLLSSAGLHLNVFTAQSQTQPEEIVKTKSILQEAYNQIHNLSVELMPSLLVRFGLLFALDDFCEKNSNTNSKIKLNTSLSIKKRYNEECELKLYFIITELINNIIKHSDSSEASISFEEIGSELLVIITDNGKGFNTSMNELTEGFGISQIRTRIKKLKGEFKINSLLNEGTTVTLKIPILNY